MKYWCYSEMCAEEIECGECGNHYLKHGKEYDWEDFVYELQKRFIFEGLCCVCGSFEVEQ